jgi:hypothetical protein
MDSFFIFRFALPVRFFRTLTQTVMLDITHTSGSYALIFYLKTSG